MTNRWWERAACLTVDPELFFKDKYPSWNHEQDAKAVCAGCPVRMQCLVEAIEQGDEDSIRGGLNPTERKKLRKKAAA